MFGESKIVEYHIQETEIAPGKKEVRILVEYYNMIFGLLFIILNETNNLWKKQILIDNKQHYKIMGRKIDMISLIKLYVENGKIVRHEDW